MLTILMIFLGAVFSTILYDRSEPWEVIGVMLAVRFIAGLFVASMICYLWDRERA